MVCGSSLLSLTTHLLPILCPGMLDVCMLSSDRTGLYIDILHVNILHINVSVRALAQLAGGTRHPHGYQTLGLAMGG